MLIELDRTRERQRRILKLAKSCKWSLALECGYAVIGMILPDGTVRREIVALPGSPCGNALTVEWAVTEMLELERCRADIQEILVNYEVFDE
ncbi:Uncharacterised protein [Mycobacteroides abscessus subsp. abscessus]|uniref:Uncharacterized protein n=1 Tax=Mycobacteroides abscessus TaxID=36809 RepID=A0AB33SYS4_9MYCO|nr:hypothetical protein [Mycobacteroides abscessus]PVB17171.1 hypothetical protein DDJ68_01755 [Mycobacteroides abscessus]RIR85503.1 hypothetical protein D2E57_21795 [Mycobacteroides abscessus]CPT00664.1 Uncharacterised protein [Mycobacteroides abscessus]CPT12402.1 Uncharacterised protein [Mycobacteroides abscessus]CPT16434.1 Uncharacterised protein [Mycobacteroides abscessus]